MVELRKRKTPAEPAPPPPSKKTSNPIKKAVETAKAVVADAKAAVTNGTGKIAVGSTIPLDGFGGEVQTHTGDKTTLSKLVQESAGGVVLFTYPKASTPGCTTQACLFRDNYASITDSSTGLAVYGLSTDSPKSNTTFATKQKLPYPLLCDPSGTLISAIGMKKPPKGTSRGVVVIDKDAKVKVWEQAGPQRTVDAVMAYLKTAGKGSAVDAKAAEKADAAKEPVPAEEPAKMDEVPIVEEGTKEEVEAAETAAEVGETAAKIDGTEEATL